MINRNKNAIRVRVGVVGDSGVGKTQLAFKFTEGTFDDDMGKTIGAEYVMASISDQALLMIADTSGQNQFRTIVLPYLRTAHIVLLCCDLTDRKTYDSLRGWLQDVKKVRPTAIIGVIGTKADLVNDRVVSDADLEQFKTENNLDFALPCSAKDGTNIDKVFHTAVQCLIGKGLAISRDDLLKRYKENGGGIFATINIFGLFNKSTNDTILAKMRERTVKNITGASAKTLSDLGVLPRIK